MQVKRWCGRISERFVCDKEKYAHCAMTVVCLFLLLRAFLDLAYASASQFQTFIEFYYYKGVVCFLAVLMLMRRVSFLNLPVLATIAVYAIASVKCFVADHLAGAYGVELRNVLVAECVAWGLVLVILVDVIRTGKRTCFNKENKVFVCIAVIAFSSALAMSFQSSLCLLCPFAALYLTPISKKQWNWFVDCLTVAYYGAFAWVMTKSLITIPYTWENVHNGYYYGIFPTPWALGLFCAGAFTCATYWFVKIWTAEKRNLSKLIPCILAMLFSVYTTLIAASRSAQVGVAGCVLFVFIFATAKKKNGWKKRGMGVLLAVAAVVVCGLLFLWLLSNTDAVSIDKADSPLRNQIARWRTVAKEMFVEKPKESDYFQNPVLKALDMLTSIRLELLVQGLKNVSLFGGESLSVVINDFDYGHPHNTYVVWLMRYGWLGGIPMIVWFFAYLVRAVKGVLKKEAVFLFSLLWGGFLVFTILMDCMTWLCPAAFVLFFVQYPLLMEQAES